jgi:hypothetical protein
LPGSRSSQRQAWLRKGGSEPIVRCTLRAIWLLVPDGSGPFSASHEPSHQFTHGSCDFAPNGATVKRSCLRNRGDSGQRPIRSDSPGGMATTIKRPERLAVRSNHERSTLWALGKHVGSQTWADGPGYVNRWAFGSESHKNTHRNASQRCPTGRHQFMIDGQMRRICFPGRCPGLTC